MTGYTVNTGSTNKFSEGWDRIFGNTASAGKTAKKTVRPEAAKSANSKKTSAKAKQRKTK